MSLKFDVILFLELTYVAAAAGGNHFEKIDEYYLWQCYSISGGGKYVISEKKWFQRHSFHKDIFLFTRSKVN